ncbi:hypothetical protein F4604DRAFT_1913696 [Suillus subluteus]|nr:hypothetical protein F4604DRAFT_1913696 [Suillus subluteus]
MVELESDDILHDAAITLLGSEHDAILVAALRVLAALVHDGIYCCSLNAGVCLITRCKNNANYGSRSTSYTYQTFEATQLLHLAAGGQCYMCICKARYHTNFPLLYSLAPSQTFTAPSRTSRAPSRSLRPPQHPLRPLLHPLVHPAHPLAPS